MTSEPDNLNRSDRVRNRVGQRLGRVKNPGRALTGQDDVSMTSAPGNLNRSDRVRNRVGAKDESGHVTGLS